MYDLIRQFIDSALADPDVYAVVSFVLVIILIMAAASILTGGGLMIDIEIDNGDD